MPAEVDEDAGAGDGAAEGSRVGDALREARHEHRRRVTDSGDDVVERSVRTVDHRHGYQEEGFGGRPPDIPRTAGRTSTR